MKDKLPIRWRKVVVTISGGSVVLFGIIAIPAPGPGWLIVFAGLSILAKEFPWAKRVLLFGRGKYDYWDTWFRSQSWQVKSLAGLLGAVMFIFMLWMTNTLGFINSVFDLELDILISPLFK